MLRVGIIGMGFMGLTHLKAWAQTPATLVGIVSADHTQAEQAVAQYGGALYNNLADLLPHVDVIDICTPTHLHREMVLQAAAAGVHIICEKPLALRVEDTQVMLDACQKAGVMLLVAHVVRFFPEYALAKAIVERGEIGRVGVVRLTRASFKPASKNPQSWFHDLSKSGGMMMDLMIHDFDYARWIAGDVETVFAKNIASRFSNVPGDHAFAILRHTNGALSHVEGGWAYPAPMFRTALEVAGSAGLIEHPIGSSVPLGIHLRQTQTSDSDIAVPSSPLAEDPYATQIRHFYDVLTGVDVIPRVTAEDGAAAVCIALAAIEFAQTGRPVAVQEMRS